MIFTTTISGETVDILNPDPATLHVEDFLWAAGNSQRYLGHTRRPYSNLEHAYWVSRFVPPEFRLAALIHDWPEIYLADLHGPTKVAMRNHGDHFYESLEKIHGSALQRKFNLDISMDDPIIKRADSLLLWYEGNELLTDPKSGIRWWEAYQSHYLGWYSSHEQEQPTFLGLGALTSDISFLREVVGDELERALKTKGSTSNLRPR